jgi:hypothetical protein
MKPPAIVAVLFAQRHGAALHGCPASIEGSGKAWWVATYYPRGNQVNILR